MNANSKPAPSIDLRVYQANRAKFPADKLVPYWGKQVAWSADGTCIVASAETSEELDKQLVALGVRFDQVVYGYVDDPNVVQL